jgi:hypothetical protein
VAYIFVLIFDFDFLSSFTCFIMGVGVRVLR